MSLEIKSKSDCEYDLVSLGEIMLRLDPGEGRIRTARNFSAWEGGGSIMLLVAYGDVLGWIPEWSLRLQIMR